jgi:hypothetical protein
MQSIEVVAMRKIQHRRVSQVMPMIAIAALSASLSTRFFD